MPDVITLNDIIEIESYANSLLEKARKMRHKMQKAGSRKRKLKSTEPTPHDMAVTHAHREKVILRARLKLEAKQRAAQL